MRNYKRIYPLCKRSFRPEAMSLTEMTEENDEIPIFGIVWNIPKDAKMMGL